MRVHRYLIIATLCGACAAGGSATPQAKEFDGKQAMAYVAKQLSFGARIPGQPGHVAEAAWLDSMARANADTVVLQKWWHKTVKGDSIAMTNVIARFNPSAKTRLLYVTHWDTRPRTDQDSKNKNGYMPGANDGGSGVAILLGVMDALKKSKPTVGVDLLFVDGEDYGFFNNPREDVLIGAEYYAKNPVTPDKPLFAVLFDMVGGKNLHLRTEGFSQVAAPEVVDRVWSTAERMGYGHIFVRASAGEITDDHVPLQTAGFKAIDLIDLSGYPAWHTTEDTIDKLAVESLEAVGNVAVAVIRGANQ